jgi:hypothetical protein
LQGFLSAYARPELNATLVEQDRTRLSRRNLQGVISESEKHDLEGGRIKTLGLDKAFNRRAERIDPAEAIDASKV